MRQSPHLAGENTQHCDGSDWVGNCEKDGFSNMEIQFILSKLRIAWEFLAKIGQLFAKPLCMPLFLMEYIS